MIRKPLRSKRKKKTPKKAPATKRERVRSPRSTKQKPANSPRQWLLPAGFSADGTQLISLHDVLSLPETSVRHLSDLSDDEQVELTAERIRGQRKFQIAMVGVGVLNKEQAVAEVKARTPAGRTLVEIEKRVVRMVVDEARAAQGVDKAK